MKLKDLMVDTKSAWLDFPGCPGFQVEVCNLSRKELLNLRKRCIAQKFDRKTRQMIEELDEDKFVVEFAKATIKGWKGLKLQYLEDLILVDLKGQDPEAELDYDAEQAEVMIQNSTEFDNWINEVVFDLANFRGRGKGDPLETLRGVAEE
jgi:hypothetical protein